MSEEHARVANELKEKGNVSYLEKNYEDAVKYFTQAIALSPENAVFYTNRSAAYFWMKHYNEALVDANHAIQLKPDWVKAYVRKAAALLALKRFDETKECYLKWQELEPHSLEAKRALTEFESIKRLEEAKARAPTFIDEFECPLCLKLFYEPVTTPCGHTFCRNCLLRALDHGAGCPVCRTIMHLSSTHPVTVTLQRLILNIFPSEYEVRKLEMESEKIQNETCLPLFLLNAVTFPKMKFPMHIFEPRYRLMMRRCLEGDKIFGLVNCRKEGNHWVPYDVGCTLRITEAKSLADGRSHVCTVAERRFKILEKWDQDGYMCGKIQWYDEEELPEADKEEFASLCSNVKCLVTNLLPKASNCAGVADLLGRAGQMPSDPVDLSFWLAGLLPLSSKVKQDLLEMKNTLTRLRILEKVLNCTESSACYIQ